MRGAKLMNLRKPREEGTGKGMCHLLLIFFITNVIFYSAPFFNILSGKTDGPPEGHRMRGTKPTNLPKPREEGTGEESKGMCHLLLIFFFITNINFSSAPF